MRIIQENKKHQSTVPASFGLTRTKIAIPERSGIRLIDVEDIYYCQADKSYTEIHLAGERLVSSKNIKNFEDALTAYGFYRVNRAFLINVRYIDRYINGQGGVVVLENGYEIDVPRRKKQEFMEVLDQVAC